MRLRFFVFRRPRVVRVYCRSIIRRLTTIDGGRLGGQCQSSSPAVSVVFEKKMEPPSEKPTHSSVKLLIISHPYRLGWRIACHPCFHPSPSTNPTSRGMCKASLGRQSFPPFPSRLCCCTFVHSAALLETPLFLALPCTVGSSLQRPFSPPTVDLRPLPGVDLAPPLEPRCSLANAMDQGPWDTCIVLLVV